jgi:small subunit ribosomal protein S20
LANIKSAKKRVITSEKARRANASARSMMRTYIKKAIAAVQSGDKENAKNAYVAAQKVLDRMVTRGIIHKKNASRHKSNLSAKVKAMA